jgi:hypothetical protein
MKNLLKFVLTICLMLTVTDMQAQVRFGPTFGLNLSTMTAKSMGISLDPKTLVGFHVGVISEFNLAGKLFLQPAFLYSTKGSKYSVMESEATISPAFIEIPVNVVYKFDSGSMKFFLEAGPYFAYGIGGKEKSDNETTDIKFGSGESNDLKPFDFGLNLGAGVEIKNFFISAHYELGIANLAPVTTDNTEMKISVIGFSIGYLLGGK